MTERIQHPLLGTVIGKAEDGVIQFLELKYASLTNRLAEPQLLSDYNGGEIYATKMGPQVVSPPNGCDMEFCLLQQRLSHSKFDISDLHGLHLNITAPNGARGLPVLVFIHGGGFAVGSDSWPQYSLTRLVKLSINEGMPILAVGINYRLGLPGFLTSEGLRAAGYKPNNGIRDQRVALKWVRRYIQGFGGSPDKVTLMGHSAGAVASMLHLQAEEPLFAQLIAMSGSPFALRPLLPVAAEASYSRCLKALDIQGDSTKALKKAILYGPMSRLWTNITPDIQVLPVIDNDVIFGGPTYQDLAGGPQGIKAVLPGTRWCKRVLLGVCQSDASTYSPQLARFKPGVADAFHKSMGRSLPSSLEAIEALEQAYNITPDTTDEVALRSIVKFASDIRFYAPVVALGDSWPGEAYIYHFNEPNPWEGPWKGKANHMMDLVYLFHNFDENLSPAQQERARQFSSHVLTFIHGKSPFPARQFSEKGAMVYGWPADPIAFVEGTSPRDFGRRNAIFSLHEGVGLDALSEALSRFLAGE